MVMPEKLIPFSADLDQEGIPKNKGKNNVWYQYNDSDTVFIFVHGIFSNSRNCWYYKKKWNRTKNLLARVPFTNFNFEENAFWPKLIKDDPNFCNPSIFLGGFYTKYINTGEYKIRDAAADLYRNISIKVNGANPVKSKKKIVFVTHSTGGIVVRHMLTRHPEEFSNSNILLLLIASPSLGAADANRLEWMAKKANQQMGLELQVDHPYLDQLDRDFKDLVHGKDGNKLFGAEAMENHFIVPLMWLFRKKILVEERSAGRYFGSPTMLANTNHFSSVKPNDETHPSYVFLKYHWDEFQKSTN